VYVNKLRNADKVPELSLLMYYYLSLQPDLSKIQNNQLYLSLLVKQNTKQSILPVPFGYYPFILLSWVFLNNVKAVVAPSKAIIISHCVSHLSPYEDNTNSFDMPDNLATANSANSNVALKASTMLNIGIFQTTS